MKPEVCKNSASFYGVRVCSIEQLPCSQVKECPIDRGDRFVRAFEKTLELLKKMEEKDGKNS